MKKLMALAFPFLLMLVLHAPVTAQDTTTATNPPATTVTTPSKARPGAERGEPVEVDPYPVGAVESTGGTPIAAAAADPVVDYNDPKTFFDEGLIGLLEAGAVAILALLGGFIPGLRTVSNKWVRSGVVIFVALVGLATFKTGALTEEFFAMLTTTFLPNFGATNFIYAAIKNILGPLLKLIKK